ncbi:bifunctional enterobactin receptor/adhesin protein [Citrobacter koseri]|uniref:Bifunctional enterobactin receptor/adhesin protein n=1 Tax=Citrobacter koseri TaxID=545 RepID=A0A2X2VFM7_CITKO|nr:bifunctional enterobactin receptor/adhesin protein [Citrobacter koseri]
MASFWASSGEKFHQKSWATYLEDEWHILDSLAFTVGSRYEHNDVFGGHFSPRGYLVWDMTDGMDAQRGNHNRL